MKRETRKKKKRTREKRHERKEKRKKSKDTTKGWLNNNLERSDSYRCSKLSRWASLLGSSKAMNLF